MESESNKVVPTVLEKADELKKKPPVAQVSQNLLDGIKSVQTLAAEAEAEKERALEEARRTQFMNKLYFYAGVFGVAGTLWLLFRYFNAKPNSRYLQEIVNGSVDLLPK